MHLQYKSFANNVEKGDIACNEQLLLPLYFLPFSHFCHFHQILHFCQQTLSVWKSLKFVVWERVNSSPIDKILNTSKFKPIAENNSAVTKMQKYVLDQEENIVGKGGDALLFPPTVF